jgi:hypothetical protein
MRQSDKLFALDGRTVDIGVKLDKALTVIDELSQTYFNQPGVDPTDLQLKPFNSAAPSFKVLFNYGSSSTYIDIAFDYIKAAQDALEELEKLLCDLYHEENVKDTAETRSKVDSIVAMLYTIHDPESIQRVYDVVYRLFTKTDETAVGTVPEKAGQKA